MYEKKQVSLCLDDYKPLREIVFETIREAILTGQMPPGERLMETQLADDLGVSRTPVREAIRKLELEGLVIMVPRRGAYVANMGIRDIAETFEIRLALESLAAKLAVERISPEEIEEMERLVVQMHDAIERQDIDYLVDLDGEFHDILFQASRNSRLAQIINVLREQIKRFRRAVLETNRQQRLVLNEHKQIIEAISERRSNLAQDLVRIHISNAEHNLMEIIGKSKEGP